MFALIGYVLFEFNVIKIEAFRAADEGLSAAIAHNDSDIPSCGTPQVLQSANGNALCRPDSSWSHWSLSILYKLCYIYFTPHYYILTMAHVMYLIVSIEVNKSWVLVYPLI